MTKQYVLLLLVITLLSSCSTIALKHEAKFKASNGKEGKFVYKKSYPVGSIKTWCIFTAIFYGGGCWAYLTYPNEKHQNLIVTDSKNKLRTLINNQDIDFKTNEVSRISWKYINEDHELFLNGHGKISPSNPKKDSKTSKEEDMGGFLK